MTDVQSGGNGMHDQGQGSGERSRARGGCRGWSLGRQRANSITRPRLGRAAWLAGCISCQWRQE